jgi:GYF domain/mRNA biogenesis factor
MWSSLLFRFWAVCDWWELTAHSTPNTMPKDRNDGIGGGDMTSWHRQKRKKEQQKNKATRIAARDAAVRETKSVAAVKDEIFQIEKRFGLVKRSKKVAEEHGNDDDGLEEKLSKVPHQIRSKLDRLKKELRLVQESEAERKSAAERAAASIPEWKHRVQAQKRSREEQQHGSPLDNPAVSVYYDAVLNPFGAPPPGQPRLYHRIGGGVTFNLSEAGLPGQAPPRPPPLDQRNRVHTGESDLPGPSPPASNIDTLHKDRSGSRQSHPPQQRLAGSVGASSGHTSSVGSDKHGMTASAESLDGTTSPTTSTPEPSQHKIEASADSSVTKKLVLELPPPSVAVQRLQRSKNRKVSKSLLADIWASTDELEYYDRVGETIEEVSATHSFKDSSTSKQGGPNIGHQAGANRDGEVAAAKGRDEWWYRDKAGAVQGPYDTDTLLQWIQAGYFPPETSVKLKEQGSDSPSGGSWSQLKDIDAFRSAFSSEFSGRGSADESKSDRIAALRGQPIDETLQSKSIEPSAQVFSLKSDVTVRDEVPEECFESSVESRIAALKGNAAPSHTDSLPATSRNSLHQPVSNGIDAARNDSQVLGRSFGEERDKPLLSGDDQAVYGYSVEDGYPVDDYPVDNDYPVTDSYPVDEEYPVTDEYPVSDSYAAVDYSYGSNPMTDVDAGKGTLVVSAGHGSAESIQLAGGQPVKKPKRDSELLSLTPSHLQKRVGR